MGRGLILENLTNNDKGKSGSVRQEEAFTVVFTDGDNPGGLSEADGQCENIGVQGFRFISITDRDAFLELRRYAEKQAAGIVNMNPGGHGV